jgi:DNA-binding response OmpR family regulator
VVTSQSKNVLVVDDEPQIVEVLEAYLQREGFMTTSTGCVSGAVDVLKSQPPDLIILDITLPDGSGYDVLQAASQDGARIPTIMLTARSDEADRIVGLEMGADDYVTKPFSPREVVARVRALLRRIEETTQHGNDGVPRRIQIGDLEIRPEFHEVRVSGRAVSLTATEFRILSILAENPGEVFTRAHLLDRLGDGGAIFERTLDRHINNLRKKVERDPSNPSYVLTVYGVGYKIHR